jgi:hypothetical protein
LARLAERDPERGLFVRIYQMLDVRPAAYWPEEVPEAAAADLAFLHAAIRSCQPVIFGHTGLSGERDHAHRLAAGTGAPPHGVNPLACCAERGDFRQFFERAMQGSTPRPGNFSDDWMALLEGFWTKNSVGTDFPHADAAPDGRGPVVLRTLAVWWWIPAWVASTEWLPQTGFPGFRKRIQRGEIVIL